MGDTLEYLESICENCEYYGTEKCIWDSPEECPHGDFS